MVFFTADVKWVKMVPRQEFCTAYLVSVNTHNPEAEEIAWWEIACCVLMRI